MIGNVVIEVNYGLVGEDRQRTGVSRPYHGEHPMG